MEELATQKESNLKKIEEIENENLRQRNEFLNNKVTIYEYLAKRLSNETGFILPTENRLLLRMIENKVHSETFPSFCSDRERLAAD